VDSVTGTITRTYDGLDRLLTETTPNGTVTYTYDAAGRRATLAVPGQATISYGYDAADRLTSITQGSAVTTFEYDTANRRTQLTQPNGVKTEYAYDAASRLTGLAYTLGSNTLGTLTYGYDAASQRATVGGTWARTVIPTAVSSATYDAANQQTAFNGQAQSHDQNGNLTGDGTNTYTWDARNRLASIAGPTAASFVYDPLGRRQRKTVDGVITDFVYDGLNPVKATVGGTTVDLLTGLGIDEYLTRTSGGTPEYFLGEALGSTVGLVDGTGAVATEYSYEPFGAATASGTSSSNELGYTGREDDGTGLYYYRARYYHPGLQRFISEDPIDISYGDPNLYVYVGNAPMGFVDPLGLERREPFAARGRIVDRATGRTLAEISPDGELIDPDTGEPLEVLEAGTGALTKFAVRFAARYLNRLPKKGGGGGKPQSYDPTTGRYATPNPFTKSPAVQFGTGLGEGLGVSLYGGELPPALGARRAGQVTGQAAGNLFNFLGGQIR
jgi:RHS repeat-associated protein